MFLHVLHDDTLYLLVYALAYKTLSSTAFWSKLKRSAIVLSLSGRLFILRKYIQHRTQINFLTRMLAWSAVVHASYILKRWNLIPLMYVMLCRRHDNWVDSADNITLKTLYSFRVRGGGTHRSNTFMKSCVLIKENEYVQQSIVRMMIALALMLSKQCW